MILFIYGISKGASNELIYKIYVGNKLMVPEAERERDKLEGWS